MSKYVYLFELDSVRKTDEEIIAGQAALYDEIVTNGNIVVLTYNQMVDSRGFFSLLKNGEYKEALLKLFDSGVIKISQYGDIRTVSQYLMDSIEDDKQFIYSALPLKYSQKRLTAIMKRCLLYSDLSEIYEYGQMALALKKNENGEQYNDDYKNRRDELIDIFVEVDKNGEHQTNLSWDAMAEILENLYSFMETVIKLSMILLGLAIIYIQRRYNVEQNSFNSIRMTRIEFDKYMKSYTQTKTEKTIVAYLLECITEVYNSIIMYNTSLSNMKKIMLDRICHNTLNWINILGSTKEGQYRLLYTCSYAEVSQLNNFKNMDISHRLGMIHEAREAFVDFLKYLWKIMLDISVKNVKSITQISDHRWLFDPVTYVDDSQKDFICLNFPEDYTNCSVILPAAKGTFKGTKRKLIDRFINLRHVPEKWFFNNNDDMQGENYYNYRVTDIRKKATIAERERDGFWIECMHCIGIDEGDWDKVEDCSMCIFKDTCVRGE